MGEFRRSGVSNLTIHEQVYHFIGSLLPDEGEAPKFAQLYIYDTENEIKNRLNIMQDVDATILQNLQDMLDMTNPLDFHKILISTYREIGIYYLYLFNNFRV